MTRPDPAANALPNRIRIEAIIGRFDPMAMVLVFLLAFIWLSARTLLLLAQVKQHTPEAQLGRAFQQELRQRGLIPERHPGSGSAG